MPGDDQCSRFPGAAARAGAGRVDLETVMSRARRFVPARTL